MIVVCKNCGKAYETDGDECPVCQFSKAESLAAQPETIQERAVIAWKKFKLWFNLHLLFPNAVAALPLCVIGLITINTAETDGWTYYLGLGACIYGVIWLLAFAAILFAGIGQQQQEKWEAHEEYRRTHISEQEYAQQLADFISGKRSDPPNSKK